MTDTVAKIADTLAKITEDRSVEVQEEAVETLAELPDGAGIEPLIKIAKTHSKLEIRQEAVEALGEGATEDRLTQIVTTLAQIAAEDRHLEVQEKTVETLAELPDGAGLESLMKIAKTHPKPEIRKEAVESLGEISHHRR